MIKRVSVKYLLLINFLWGILFFYSGCENKEPDSSQTNADQTKRQTLVNKVRGYLTDSPKYFIPPATTTFPDWGNGTNTNGSGAIAWTSHAFTNNGTHETKSSFKNRLDKATPKELTQTHWNQYMCGNNDAGFPGGPQNTGTSPTYCDAGMLCYVLVARALEDAGYSINVNYVGSCNFFSTWNDVTSTPNIGDIVLYDFNQDASYDHVGIITEKVGSNVSN
ncbi:MAG: hypothetical protein C0417_01015 [Chlorobiaceae bacterium]|nr:hypothetical protein [Chlorobiaceae bacterium]